MRRIPPVALIAALAGCATAPPVTGADGMCQFVQKVLIVEDPAQLGTASEAGPPPGIVAIPKPVLVLSGGSQNGAFGAGFLDRWAARSPGGKLPDFGLVTGISTGAILATWAFIAEPGTVARAYNISHESELLDVYRKPAKDGKLGFGAALTLLRKNSLADLDPLRGKLRAAIDRQTLEKVVRRPGRLVIAAVELDTGQFVSFDMKEMAARAIRPANSQARFEHLRNCYVEAIMASSSVPLAAQPIFIDNRMYIDGGARHGVYVDYLAGRKPEPDEIEAYVDLSAPGPLSGPLPDAPRLYILINGTQQAAGHCGKLDAAHCTGGTPVPDPLDNRDGAHAKWDIAALALRSSDILVNQIYRLSASHVQASYLRQFPGDSFTQHFHFSRMEPADLGDPAKFTYNGKSCMAWHETDKVQLRPLEFFPNYMRCLQAYGAHRADQLQWYQPGIESNFEAAAE